MKILKNYVTTLVKSVVVIFTMVSVVSCQKNKDDSSQPEPGGPAVPANPALGFWQGHYRFTGSLANHNLKILIKPGGFARLYDMDFKTDTAEVAGSSKADGTWTLTGNKLEMAMVSDGPVLFSGAINSDTGKWTGSWKRNGDVKGTFTLSK